MSDIFREVEEDVRQEQIINFLQTYMWHIVGAIVGLIVIFAAYNFWQSSAQSSREEASDQFEQAMQLMAAGRGDEAQPILAALREDRGLQDYGMLATLREAEIERDAGNIDAAVALYDDVAENADADRFIRDVAALASATVLINSGRGDEGVARLDTLIDDDSHVSAVALEHKAHYLYGQGEFDAARAIFTELAEGEAATSSVALRARQTLSIIERTGPGVAQ